MKITNTMLLATGYLSAVLDIKGQAVSISTETHDYVELKFVLSGS